MSKKKKGSYPDYFYGKEKIKTYQPFEKFLKDYKFDKEKCKVPVVISIFAQESESFNGDDFAASLEAEITNVKNNIGSTPVYYMMQINNASERKIAKYLLGKNCDLIIVGEDGKTPMPEVKRYICTKHPVDFMLDCCWTMFAFWDGEKGSQKGAYVEKAVERMLKGNRHKERDINKYNIKFPNRCEIVHFLLRRRDINITEFKARYLYAHFAETGTNWYYVTRENYKEDDFITGGKAGKKKKKAIERQNEQLTAFNDALEQFGINVKDEADNILPAAYEDNVRINDIRNKFAFYDAFALKNQKSRSHQTTLLIFIGVLAFIAFGIFSDIIMWWWMLLIYAALFVYAVILYLKTNKSRSHENYIIGRVFAECMRVQGYWYAMGIDRSARLEYPVYHRSKLEWIYRSVNAIHAINMSLGGGIGNADDKEVSDHVTALWFGKEEYDEKKHTQKIYNVGQLKYCDNKLKLKSKTYNRSQAVSKAVYVISVALTVLLVLAVVVTRFFSLDFIAPSSLELFVTLAIFLIGILPVIITAVEISRNVKSYKEEVESHDWSLKLTKRALTDIQQDSSMEMKQKVFEKYGTQILNENGDWALMKLEHRPEILKN